MSQHLTPEQNSKLRAAMLKAIDERYDGKRANLADAIGISQPSLSDFLNEKGGASRRTADLFAQRVLRMQSADPLIGARTESRVMAAAVGKPRGVPVPPDVRRKAIVLLQQPPQRLSLEAIEIAEECTVFTSEEDARNPAAVAEAWRRAILGTAASLPTPSDVPPLGTRRSRRRAS